MLSANLCRCSRESSRRICRATAHRLPAGEAPALQIILEASLRAFFEGGGFATQMGENFAREMQ